MSTKVTVKAPAKLNLSLDCLGTLPNGYHDLSMVMQTVELHDTVKLQKSDTIEVYCDAVKTDNIAASAAKAFFAQTGISRGVSIHIEKRIPIAAGLAGGSADAAATLVGLNALYNAELTKEQLCEIGAKIGADVPFCIIGGTCHVQGIGEKITSLSPLPDCSIILIKQGEKSSTGEMYRKLDALPDMQHPETEQLILAIQSGDLVLAARLCKNVFTDLYNDEKRQLINLLLQNGALGAELSGSGPSVYGIFDDEDKAQKCFSALQNMHGEIFLTKPVPYGSLIV